MDTYKLCVLFVILLFNLCKSYNNNTLLLIMSFDGFRYDYIERYSKLTNTLAKFRNHGTHASYMTSVFPSKTFTNHFSIATGLYSEVHGVLDNQIFDQQSNKTLGYGYELFHYNKDIVPIWILNEVAEGGRRSGCMMWPASNFPYQGVSPSYVENYNKSIPLKDRIKTVLNWFKHPEEPINLGMVYYEEPDKTSHMYGINSIEIQNKIAQIDKGLQYLLEEAENAGLLERLNIIIVSDHGMNTVKYPENIIHLDQYVDEKYYIKNGKPPTLQIYPVDGKESQVLYALKSASALGGHFNAYSRSDMLERWHYKNSERTPPILVIADLGYSFITYNNEQTNTTEIGAHGYDPLIPNMRAIFMATGPLIKKNYKIRPFENINIYPLVVHMLDLPMPKVCPNGTLEVLKHILVSEKSTGCTSEITWDV